MPPVSPSASSEDVYKRQDRNNRAAGGPCELGRGDGGGKWMTKQIHIYRRRQRRPIHQHGHRGPGLQSLDDFNEGKGILPHHQGFDSVPCARTLPQFG